MVARAVLVTTSLIAAGALVLARLHHALVTQRFA
jgi:hypothetical protein